MRKFIATVFVALSLPLMAGIHTYVDQSVLRSGKWVKIRVSESGVCRMTFEQLSDAGLNPSQLRVYGYGGAMLKQDFSKPKIDDLPQVPVYIGSGYVLFWVQGPIGWSYNGSRFVHTHNTYSNYGYYFLTDNIGELLPPTIDTTTISGTPTDVTTYLNYQVHELDSINLIDRAGIVGGGREWYGEQFSPYQRRTFLFATPNALTTEKSTAYMEVASKSDAASTFHCTFNGTGSTVTVPAKGSDRYTEAQIATFSPSATSTANRQQIQLTYQNSNASTLGWLNYIELTTPSALIMTGGYMPIRTKENYKTATPVRFRMNEGNSNMQVWDITDLKAIKRVPTTITADTLKWIGSQQDGIHEYVVVNPNGSSWVSATVIGSVSNQNLHSLSNKDYVIICPEGYVEIAEDLAKAHQAKQGITWTVVTDQQVYNEFSSGTPDATAYRWLMKMLYDRADESNGIMPPKWLLLMGHGTFDNRKLLSTSGEATLLTYQAKNSLNEVNAYATDDYFGFLEDNEGESDVLGTMEIGVGRLPVNNTTEAREVVDKLIKYMRNENAGKWKNQLVYLADDGEGGTHTKTAEVSAEMTRLANPDLVVIKIFLDAYPQEVSASGESYPVAKNKVAQLLKSGVLFFDYSGHGGYNNIASEGILTIKEIEKMHNTNLGFWLFATCNYAQFDGGKRCSAEACVLNPNGGAVGILAATRTVYATQNTLINRDVCSELFAHENTCHYEATLGEAIMRGKNKRGADANKMPYVLLGDPALRLNFPTNYQIATTTVMDTLNALDVQMVQGQIVNEDSVPVDFNGDIDIIVYDKIQEIPTRDNDNVGGTPEVVSYKDYPNVLFSGNTKVKEGNFQYTFMVPKDIRYNFGNGRIVYYAHDTIDNSEAVGHFEDFIVGGSGSSFIVDTIGPEMTLYLNSIAFQDGGKTDSVPRFFADLSDEHGINTAGAGIGHDLMLVVDGDAKQTYSLNEYFTSSSDSYQQGRVSYKMTQLPNGPHTLTFRAWDLLNNSTTKSLNFVVEAGLDVSIKSVTTYPNPVRAAGVLNMIVNYDQPDELIHTEICLYNTNGQMIWKQEQGNPDQVTLYLAQMGLQPGVYFYSVRIKSDSSKYANSSGKIIVVK